MHQEAETNITKILRLIDSDMVDDTPGAVNALTRKGTAFATYLQPASVSPRKTSETHSVARQAWGERPGNSRLVQEEARSQIKLGSRLERRMEISGHALQLFKLSRASAPWNQTSWSRCRVRLRSAKVDPSRCLLPFGGHVAQSNDEAEGRTLQCCPSAVS